MTDDLPHMALSIMQPWAWLIVNRHKAIENRDWPTRFRGPVAIHAGKKVDRDTAEDVRNQIHPMTGYRQLFDLTGDFETGGIVGVAEIVDCVDKSDDVWFVGEFGFVLRNAQAIPFIPVKGALGFFDWRKNIIEPQPVPAPAQGSLL